MSTFQIVISIGNYRCFVDDTRRLAYSRWMTEDKALEALAALAHPTRLSTVRVLVCHDPEGVSTGRLVALLGLTQSTFSTHLAVLVKAGLVTPEKRGRQMIQRANADTIRATGAYLSAELLSGLGTRPITPGAADGDDRCALAP